MVAAFFYISLFGLLYFLLAKRRFDYFTLSFFSAVFYFSPGFIGHVPTYFMSKTEVITSETYFVMNIVMVVMLLATVLFDVRFSRKKHIRLDSKIVKTRKMNFAVKTLLVVACLSAVGNFLTIDRNLLAGGVEKAELLNNNTYFYNFWVYTSLLALFFSYYLGRKLYFLIAFLLLLLDVYFYAMRVHIVLALMAIIFYWLHSQGPLRLILKVHYGIFLGPLLLFFFIFKSLMRPLNEGNYGLVIDKILNIETYMYWLVRAEPFNQVAILNKTMTQDFIAPASHLLMSVVSLIPYSGSIDFGIKPRFHDYFYPTLFPNMEIGAIASNPWAQLVSSGGVPMLMLGALAFVSLIFIFNYKISFTQPSTINIVLFSIAPVICFYMHRNDLYFTVLMVKRFVLPLVGLFLVRYFFYQLSTKRMNF